MFVRESAVLGNGGSGWGLKKSYPDGADGGGRTHTLSRVLDFESSASANSATSALPNNPKKIPTKVLCGKAFHLFSRLARKALDKPFSDAVQVFAVPGTIIERPPSP